MADNLEKVMEKLDEVITQANDCLLTADDQIDIDQMRLVWNRIARRIEVAQLREV